MILSPLLFPYVSEFEVLSFDPMISDVHSGVHLSLCNEIGLNENPHHDSTTVTRAKWNNAEAHIFVERLNSFVSKVDALSNDQESARDINTLTAECSSIVMDAANEAEFIKESKLRPFKHNINLNTNLLSAHGLIMSNQNKRAKNLRHRVNNVENFKYVYNASKAYKKCINKQFSLYEKDFINKLRSLIISTQTQSHTGIY